PKTLEKFKESIREKTSRKTSISLKERIKRLNRYLKGWIGYFNIADMKSHLERIGSWIRRRLRMCVWKQWKNVGTRIRNLKKLGLKKVEAIKFGNSRKGYWRLSKCYQLHNTLDNKFWSDNGLVNPIEAYLKHRQ
ncbi:MAG: group II intron maturase-specific domain-containing protein, partial [Halanaerobiales bacterium]